MANKTLLGYVQDLCRKQGLSIPSGVVANTDETITQIWGLFNEEVIEMANRGEWNELRNRVTFNHANASDYGALLMDDDTGPYFINTIVPNTLWCSTTRIPLAGPLKARQWAQVMALSTVPAVYSYRIYNSYLRIYPVPTDVANTYFQMEYVTAAVFQDSTGADKAVCDADTDVVKLPTRIVEMGLRWRWKKEKGLPYAEDQRSYEYMIADQLGSQDADTPQRLDGHQTDALPMIIVSPGSWNV